MNSQCQEASGGAARLDTDDSPFPPLAPVLGLPMQGFGVDARLASRHALGVSLPRFGRQRQHVLALEVADKVEVLEGGYNVLLLYARHLRYLAVSDRQ